MYALVVCKAKQYYTVGTETAKCSSRGKTLDLTDHMLKFNTYLLQLGTVV